MITKKQQHEQKNDKSIENEDNVLESKSETSMNSNEISNWWIFAENKLISFTTTYYGIEGNKQYHLLSGWLWYNMYTFIQ